MLNELADLSNDFAEAMTKHFKGMVTNVIFTYILYR